MSFKRFDSEDILISSETISQTCWSDNTGSLAVTYTSTSQKNSTSGDFYTDVYNIASTNAAAEVQFAVAYGDADGGGAVPFNSSVSTNTPSSVMYKQARIQLLGTEESLFTINGTEADSIYIISIERSRYKEKLLPGSLTININGTDYTDDSQDQTSLTFSDTGRVYNIVAGAAGVTSNSTAVGLFYPDAGILILTGSLGNSTNTGTHNGSDNHATFITNDLDTFTLRNEETITSNYVFVRARNSEFNYSNNPSNITGSGELRHDIMVDTPQSYISAVGLYNDNNDLLAVAKLSRPLLKDFTKEALLRIKLDF